MHDLKIGLIGPGEIAQSHLLPALSNVSGAVLWGVAGRDQARSTEIARRFGAVHSLPGFDDWRIMLACAELDAVIIATPDRLHAPMAIAALEAGKHVFIEKPMATSVWETEAIRKAALASGKTVAVGYHHRFHEDHLFLEMAVARGDIGTPLSFRGVWHYPSEDGWRNRADASRWWSLAAVGTHLIDLAWYLLGKTAGEVVETSVLTSAPVYGRHDEQAVFTMKFASGALAEIMVSVHGPETRMFEIVGTTGIVQANRTLGGSGRGQTLLMQNGDWGVLDLGSVDPYAAELRDFVSAIREGRPPMVGIDVGAKNVEWLSKAG